jgi:hypothetical protein
MYGIKVPSPDLDDPVCGETGFLQLAHTSFFGSLYNIAGLEQSAFEAANRVMAWCLKGEDRGGIGKKLDDQFYVPLEQIYSTMESRQRILMSFPAKVFAENLAKLRRTTDFEDFLLENPRLAVDMLHYLTEKQSKVEDGQ